MFIYLEIVRTDLGKLYDMGSNVSFTQILNTVNGKRCERTAVNTHLVQRMVLCNFSYIARFRTARRLLGAIKLYR